VAQRPPAPCLTPGCPELVASGRCPEHTAAHRRDRDRAYDARRPTAAGRGYDAGWRRVRGAYLKAHPRCETPGCLEPATEVDHLDGVGPRGDNRWTNLRALCHAHHSSRTARDQGIGAAARRRAGQP
jgi:5-methylcytosine-specific restriction protein A